MEKISNKNYFLINLGASIKFISTHLIICLWVLFLLSFIELVITWQIKGLPNNFFQLLIISLTHNVLFWVKFIWIIYLVFIPLLMMIKNPAKAVLKVIIIIFFTLHILLTNYFNTALIPLGADVYGYSLQDVQETLVGSGVINLIRILTLIVVFSFLIYIFFFGINKITFTRYTALIVPIISFILIFSNLFSVRKELKLNSDFANNLVFNKSEYFYEASLNHFFPFSNRINKK